MLAQSLRESSQYLRSNNYDQAYRIMQKISKQNPYSIQVLINKSTINIEKGNIEQGLVYLKKAREIDPFDFRLYYNMFVIYWRSRQYYAAFQSFRKCLSLSYILKIVNADAQTDYQSQVKNINRALQLWQQNTAAYAIKAIRLINLNKIQEANQVTKLALQKSIMKHHIFAICCMIDDKLNQKAQRQKNAKNYHIHLLRPLIIPQEQYPSLLSQSRIKKNEQIKIQINKLRQQFNILNKQKSLNVGQYRRYGSNPGVYFVTMKKKTSINIQYQISKDLGLINLQCIDEQVEHQVGGGEEEQDEQIIKKTNNKNINYQQQIFQQDNNVQTLKQPKVNFKLQHHEQQQIEQKNKDSNNNMNTSQNKNNSRNQNNSRNEKQQQTNNTITNSINNHNQQMMLGQQNNNSEIKKTQQQQNIQTKSNKSKGPVKVHNWDDVGIPGSNNVLGNQSDSQEKQQIKLEHDPNLVVVDNHQHQSVPVSQQKYQSQISNAQTTQLSKYKSQINNKQPSQAQLKTQSKMSQSSEMKTQRKNKQEKKTTQQSKTVNKSTQSKTMNKSTQQKQKYRNMQSEQLYPITHHQFQVKLLLADLQINQQLIGKMDPYVYYQYGNQIHKSTIAKGQGHRPRWQNQIKIFSLEKLPTNMKVSVYDREIFKWDDLVGVGNFQVVKTGMHILPIYLKDKKAGEVMFVITKV